MRNKLIGVGFLVVCILGIILPSANSSSSSILGDVKRSRRQAAVTNEATTPGGDCADLEGNKSKCKSDSCPKDDKTIEICCNCVQTCCASENGTSAVDTMMMGAKNGTELNLTSTTPSPDAKSKISEVAGKVGGFFKNFGESIKHGVDSGWDKVKHTAIDVKESVRKGVNSGADWVRNKTVGDNPAESKKSVNSTCGNDSNCTSGVNDGDIMDNMNSSTPGSSVTQEPSKKVKRSNSDSDMDSDEVKQYSPKNKIKITVSTNRGASNKRNNDDVDATESSSEESDSSSSSSNGSNSKSNLRPAQEKGHKKDSSQNSGWVSTTSSSTTNNTGTATRKPVPGMQKSRKRRQVQGSYNYQTQHSHGTMVNGSDERLPGDHPPSWGSSSRGPGYGSGFHSGNAQGIQRNTTTTTVTTGSTSSMDVRESDNLIANQQKLRTRRDVPPGMMVERNKQRKEEEERRQNETNARTSADMDPKDQKSRSAPVDNETEIKMPTTMSPPNMSAMNDKDGSYKVRSKREPAGPPSNSQNMRTTTATAPPAMLSSTKVTSDEGRRHRRAPASKLTTKPSPTTSTIDPLGGDETNSSTSMSADEDSPRNPPPNSERETKVWISVSSTSSTVKAATASPSPNNNGHPIGADIVLVPVRTSGSVVADGISHKKQKKSEGSSLPSLTGSGPIIDSTSLGDGTSPEPEVQELSPLQLPPAPSTSAMPSDDVQSKPGRCRPLSQGLQCVSLGRDSAQCKDDAGCEGSKKCCFYSCKPNSDIGICDHPIFS